MPTIAVIVPVYNAEDTLERCVGSILAQTHSNLDILLVDDGSTDIGGMMCDAYAELDSRVRVFHTPNRGLSSARNLGLDYALSGNAELLSFVDADDYMEPYALETLLNAMQSSQADIVQCGYRNEGLLVTMDYRPHLADYDTKEALEALIEGGISNDVWAKLYSKRIFETLRFPEGRVYEEVSVMHRIMLLCEKVTCVPDIEYHYVMREGSITHTANMKNLADFWNAYKERRDYLNERIPGFLDERLQSKLEKDVAYAISRMWRWAFSNSPDERISYQNLLEEMSRYVKKELRCVNKNRWPLLLRASLIFTRSTSTVSLAMAYFANQTLIRLFPEKSRSRR